MGKAKTFRVVNHRFQFKCDKCGTRKYMAIPSHLRQRSVRCHKCGEIVRCSFNRRATLRELQSGKAVLITNSGKDVEIFLSDVSSKGLGFEMSIRAMRSRAIKIGDQIQVYCSWSPRLLSNSRYVVQNIRGQRVGVKKLEQGMFK